MDQHHRRDEEVSSLRERLARLSKASLRINESLEFDAVLQGVLESGRELTEARNGAIILLDDEGRAEDIFSSGLTPEEAERLWNVPDAAWSSERLGRLPGPLRLPDLPDYLRSQGLGVPRQPFLPNCRPLNLPVHLLGRGSIGCGRSSLAALLCGIGPVAGDVEFQDDGVVHHPVNRRSGGHGVGEDALPL